MKSLEERHAERNLRRKEGPGPVVIEKDQETDTTTEQEEEREPMRNKQPGSSKEPAFFEQKVQGDDSIRGGFTPTSVSDEETAVARASVRAAKTSAGEGVGNGGGKDGSRRLNFFGQWNWAVLKGRSSKD